MPSLRILWRLRGGLITSGGCSSGIESRGTQPLRTRRRLGFLRGGVAIAGDQFRARLAAGANNRRTALSWGPRVEGMAAVAWGRQRATRAACAAQRNVAERECRLLIAVTFMTCRTKTGCRSLRPAASFSGVAIRRLAAVALAGSGDNADARGEIPANGGWIVALSRCSRHPASPMNGLPRNITRTPSFLEQSADRFLRRNESDHIARQPARQPHLAEIEQGIHDGADQVARVARIDGRFAAVAS